MATTAEGIRREVAEEWGRVGAAWGVSPSTATVQGYLLARPSTDPQTWRSWAERNWLAHSGMSGQPARVRS